MQNAGNDFARVAHFSLDGALPDCDVSSWWLFRVVVELAMTLPMAIYFHRITIFALPVNVLILPLLLC